MLPRMAFTGFAARYREPSADEGFQDVTKVDFKVCIGMQVEFGEDADWFRSLKGLRNRRRSGRSIGFLDRSSHLVEGLQGATTPVRQLSQSH
jgi:hypothetical protein